MRSKCGLGVALFTLVTLSGFGGEGSGNASPALKPPPVAMNLDVFRRARATTCESAPDSLYSTTDTRGKTVLCVEQSGKYLAGQLKVGCFKTLNQLAKETAKKAKKNSRLKKKATSQKANAKKGNALCKGAALGGGAQPTPTPRPNGDGGGNGGGNPTPTPTPTRTPTPTPNPLSCFDSNHQNTKAGCFSIPNGTTGNVARGSTLWSSGSGGVPSCRGCHGTEYLNRSYSQLAALLPASPMFINASQQQIADLTAYLNRYKQ